MFFNSTKKVLSVSVAMLATSLFASAFDYQAKVMLTDDENGAMAYLVNYDTGAKVDSVTVADELASFTGKAETPFMARLIIDGQRMGSVFIVEEGVVSVNPAQHSVSGGVLTTIMNDFEKKAGEIATRYHAAKDDAEREAIYGEYTSYTNKVMDDNIKNVVGYYLFLQQAYEMEASDVIALVEKHPVMKSYQRVDKLLAANRNKAATQPGAKFADFEYTYDGVTYRLSDVVGKGQYVLVDFWASWCGPCIRQTKVIKELYNEYKDKGLKVLGVAVWDEPDNTRQAIATHGLEWESWLNAQNVPTDVYGISGIPCIILFGPDGTILSRDKQDEALKADVRAALEKSN